MHDEKISAFLRATGRPWSYVTGPALKGAYHSVEDHNGEQVAECYDGDEARCAAHGKLIALAPDLLEYVASSASAGCATAKALIAKL